MKPNKWEYVYPQGTKEGDEEYKFFICLSRNAKFMWFSTSLLSKQTGLSLARIEEIIEKYHKKGMVFNNPKNEDQWGYWERIPSDYLPQENNKSILQKDHEERIKKSSGMYEIHDPSNMDFFI